MRGKTWIAGFTLLILSLTSGCRLCERWYEREHDPYDRECRDRPRYWQQPCCPQGCVPQCPTGCTPAGGYGAGYPQAGFAPSYGPNCGCQ